MGVGVVQTEPNGVSYYRIPLQLYAPGDLIEDDIYFSYQGQYVLYRLKNLPWKKEDFDRLTEAQIENLYMRFETKRDHEKFLQKNLSKVLESNHISEPEKSNILYQTSLSLVEEIFEDPHSVESLRRSMSSVKSTIHHLNRSDSHFFSLMEFATSNFSEYSHALHTTAYSLRLAQTMGVKAYNDLAAIGVASLLHDIGKSRIPREILDKPSALSEDELKLVQLHPQFSYELVHDSRSVPELSERIILQHHERPTGKGYPRGLTDDIHYFSKIVALADCFDSLTSDRHFQAAIKPMQAVERLRGDLKDDYDQKLLVGFIQMLKRVK
jgi:HD-GYP domain-containing protein (c-di-GMP phosphodiesterase class II)